VLQFLPPRCLQQSRIQCVVSAWASGHREITFSNFWKTATCPFTEPRTARFRFHNSVTNSGPLRENCSVIIPPFRCPCIIHKTCSTAQCAFSVLLMPYTANLNSQFSSCFSSYILCKCQTEGPHYRCVSFITCNFKLIIIIIIFYEIYYLSAGFAWFYICRM
jgi:hypothetical protein